MRNKVSFFLTFLTDLNPFLLQNNSLLLIMLTDRQLLNFQLPMNCVAIQSTLTHRIYGISAEKN